MLLNITIWKKIIKYKNLICIYLLFSVKIITKQKVTEKTMKKLLFILALSACLFSALVSCASTPKKSKAIELDPIEIDYVTVTSGNITYTNQPQFELMALVCRMAGVREFQGYYTDNNAYLEQMMTLLGKYKDHNIVNLVRGLNSRGISGSGFVSLAYHIKPDFSGTTVSMNPKPDTLNWEWQNVPSHEINSLVKALHDFAIECKYARLYLLNKADSISICNQTKENLEKYKFYNWMTDFFSNEVKEEIVINISRANAAFSFYDYVTWKYSLKKYYLSFYPGLPLYNCAHTYAMCFVQDYANENWDTVKDDFTKYTKEKFQALFPDKKSEINNLQVTNFALVTLMSIYPAALYYSTMLDEIEGQPGAFEEVKNAVSKQFGEESVKLIFDTFDIYSQNRNIYKDFKSFYPQINKKIHEVAK